MRNAYAFGRTSNILYILTQPFLNLLASLTLVSYGQECKWICPPQKGLQPTLRLLSLWVYGSVWKGEIWVLHLVMSSISLWHWIKLFDLVSLTFHSCRWCKLPVINIDMLWGLNDVKYSKHKKGFSGCFWVPMCILLESWDTCVAFLFWQNVVSGLQTWSQPLHSLKCRKSRGKNLCLCTLNKTLEGELQ
jgi:hypothetical protein